MPLKELLYNQIDSQTYPDQLEQTIVHKFEGFESNEEAWKLYGVYCQLSLLATVETKFNEAIVTLYTVLPKSK